MGVLEDRLRCYEIDKRLPINMPIIVRIDGRAFTKFTRGMERPFDENFISMMNEIAIKVCSSVQNCRFAFIQSDEISFLLYQKNWEEDGWFSNKVEKICSVISSLASSIATRWCIENYPDKNPIVSFDARANVYPSKEVVNYFIWRQYDWERNSLFMVASSYYSPKELMYKKNFEQQEMIFQAGDNWNNYKTYLKRGRCCIKVRTRKFIQNKQFEGEVDRTMWVIDNEIPEFAKCKEYVFSKLDNDYDELNAQDFDYTDYDDIKTEREEL